MADDEWFDTERTPHADSFRVCFCGHCPNGHVVLLDEQGEPIAVMVVTYAQAVGIADSIEQYNRS